MAEPEAAVAIVQVRSPEPAVLLMRRTERAGDPWSGHWSFPGGRRDPDDGDLLDTALRELEEECGIRLRRDQVETPLEPVLARRRIGPYLLVAPFVFQIEAALPAILDAREAVEACWLPIARLLDPACHCLLPVAELPDDMRFPAIELNAVPLWGFTYRVITGWLGLGPQPPVEEAGFQEANRVLDFLLAQGLALAHPWRQAGAVLRVAEISGTIPVERLLAHCSLPRREIPALNRLEVRPDYVRLTGLAFEEYLIRATPGS